MRPATAARLALVTRTGVLTFAGLVGLLHLLRRDLDPVRNFLSLYAVGRWGPLMTIALLSLGAGAAALAIVLSRGDLVPGEPRPAAWLGRAALAVYAAGLVTIAIFPTDGLDVVVATRTDAIHAAAATTLFVALAVATTTFSLLWPGMRPLGLVLSAVAIACLLLFPAAGRHDLNGLVQRTFTAVTLVWLFIAAGRVRRASAEAARGSLDRTRP
jgi:hypothetical protein